MIPIMKDRINAVMIEIQVVREKRKKAKEAHEKQKNGDPAINLEIIPESSNNCSLDVGKEQCNIKTSFSLDFVISGVTSLNDLDSRFPMDIGNEGDEFDMEDEDENDDGVYNEKDQNEESLHALTARYTHWLEILHRVVFYIACNYNSLDMLEQETDYYARAERIRRLLLRDAERRVRLRIKELTLDSSAIAEKIEAMEIEYVGGRSRDGSVIGGGIKSRGIFERIDDVIDSLNNMWELLVEWRQKILEALSSSLEDTGTENVGEEPISQSADNIQMMNTVDVEENHDGSRGNRINFSGNDKANDEKEPGIQTDSFNIASKNHNVEILQPTDAVVINGGPTGQEYEEGLSIQGQANVYLEAYQLMLKARRDLILPMTVLEYQHFQANQNTAKRRIMEDVEKGVLNKLNSETDSFKRKDNLKSLQLELKSAIKESLPAVEVYMMDVEQKRLGKVIENQMSALNALES